MATYTPPRIRYQRGRRGKIWKILTPKRIQTYVRSENFSKLSIVTAEGGFQKEKTAPFKRTACSLVPDRMINL